MKPVRTRFAPSPTGLLHVGGARTALFAWLVARQQDGVFVLRIEDTDKVREVAGSIDHIKDSLSWLGIDWDEGPGKGEHGPYLQSERLAIYRRWAQKLVDEGRAYADPTTPEQLNKLRETAKAEKRAFLYREHRPENPPAWDGSQPLRFKSVPKSYSWHDEVMGELHSGPEVIDDFILLKSDGYPTYNFCHIVDDALMEISHVIRSQEFISSVPKYLNLYEALGLEPPTMATLPFVMASDGKRKLSKRDGAKDLLDYRREGYLPEALMNFLATLGWNDGTEQEIFSADQLRRRFSLARVQRSGARFDESRLTWLNGQWIRRLGVDELMKRVDEGGFWPAAAKTSDETYRMTVLNLVSDRLKTLADIPALTDYFFTEPVANWSLVENNKQLNKLTKPDRGELLRQAISALEPIEFTPDALSSALNSLLTQTGQKPGVLFSLIRVVTTWAPFSPALPETLAVLGKETTLERLRAAL